MKKWKQWAGGWLTLCLSLVLLPAAHATEAADGRMSGENSSRTIGNINRDRAVDVYDAAYVLQYNAHLMQNVSLLDLDIGDVNGDGKVDTSDASLILRYDARLIEKLEPDEPGYLAISQVAWFNQTSSLTGDGAYADVILSNGTKREDTINKGTGAVESVKAVENVRGICYNDLVMIGFKTGKSGSIEYKTVNYVYWIIENT